MNGKRLKLRDIWGYVSGEGATALIMGGMGNFGMLFYTQIFGMRPELVGIALSVATLWDAITDPLMGTITDRTAGRFGRRHPYMLIGGILMALCFFALWFIPESFQGEKALFWYLLLLNIVIKTAFTVFYVPHTALGFEICQTDNDRARVQGIRSGFSQIINFIFGGLGWMLFFQDRMVDGVKVDGNKIHENYLRMGGVLTIGAILLVLFCVFITYKFADKGLVRDDDETMGDHVKAFVHDLKDVYGDKLVWFVFGFLGIAQFSMIVTGQVQMFTYIEFMRFCDLEKTIVHSGGMIGFTTGAMLLGSLVKRFDKRKTGYLAMATGSGACLALFAIFSGGLMAPESVLLFEIGDKPYHLSSLVFGLLQATWWGSCGVLVPLAASMVADLATIKKLKTGEVTEGRYGAGFSFFMKAASAFGVLVTGYVLKGVGYVSGAETQTADTIDRLAVMTFVVGPIFIFISFLILRKYPITHQVMNQLREQYGRENI